MEDKGKKKMNENELKQVNSRLKKRMLHFWEYACKEKEAIITLNNGFQVLSPILRSDSKKKSF